MKIIVTGASGLIGSALVPTLVADGHQVTRLVRGGGGTRPPAANVRDVVWHPERGELEAASVAGHEAAIHLAGENVADGRWTKEKKQRIRDSRVDGTRLLAATLAQLDAPPSALLCASATGYYGNRGDEQLSEASAPGTDFLAGVCQEWEAAAAAARAAGVRVVSLRFGVVLSADGGALAKMLTPFKLGVGGKIGDGTQYLSWITLGDAVGAIRHALVNEDVSGAVNVVAPAPATNAEFTHALGHAVGRPTLLSVPAFALRLGFGEMADALLSSARVEPAQLKATGYQFQHPTLDGALRSLLDT